MNLTLFGGEMMMEFEIKETDTAFARGCQLADALSLQARLRAAMRPGESDWSQVVDLSTVELAASMRQTSMAVQFITGEAQRLQLCGRT